MLTTARPIPFSSRMNGQNARMNSSVGFTTISAVASDRSSAMVFGASSPSTMCSAVTMANAIATAILCAGCLGDLRRQERERRLHQAGQGRLADPAQPEAGHRDPELGRGNVAVGIDHRPAHRARAPVPLGDHLIDAGLADRDDRELRGDEEPVGEDQRQDRRETPQNSCERVLHGVTLAARGEISPCVGHQVPGRQAADDDRRGPDGTSPAGARRVPRSGRSSTVQVCRNVTL